MKITVHVESEPSTPSISGEPLSRPTPAGGAFLIMQRIERPTWEKMRAAGAVYFSADDLEDMDMFHAAPGWRYSLDALAVLIEAGNSLNIRGEEITTTEQLHAMFTDEAKAAYRRRVEEQRAEAERIRREEAARAEAERAAKGAAYEQWRAEHLAGLVYTTATPPDGVGVSGEWVIVARFDKETPGAWYDTGDTWRSRQYDGQTVYSHSYGNAIVYYAPQALVDAWCEAAYRHAASPEGWSKGDEVAVARAVATKHAGRCFGNDVYRRLVELHGLEHYLNIARSREWVLTNVSMNDRENAEAAARLGIPHTIVTEIEHRLSHAEQMALARAIDAEARSPFEYHRADDGRIFARSGFYDNLRLLTAEQARMVMERIG